MYLDILVMRSVKNSPLSGSEIADSINSNVGWRPSPGSVYPLLKKLEDNGFVMFNKSKKKKLYSLTAKGTDYLQSLEEKDFMEHFEKHIIIFKSLSRSKDDAKLSRELEGFEGLDGMSASLLRFKQALFEKIADKKKRKEIEEVLNKAVAELKRL